MKKLYILFILTLTVSFAQAQWAGFNNAGGDNLWSNDANWGLPGGVTELPANELIDIYGGATVLSATLDEDYTAKQFSMHAAKSENFTLTGDKMLTVDIANATQANDNNGAKAIWNQSATATTLTFDCDVTIANSVTPETFKGVSVLSTTSAGSIIEFAAGKTLNLGGTSTTSFWGLGEVHVNGNITGSQGILLGAGAKAFIGSSTSDVSGYTGALTLGANSDLTLNSNGSSTISNLKLQVNGSPCTLTLEGENVFTPDGIRVSKNTGQAYVLDMNINANQTFKAIKIKGNNSILNLNIDPSVTSVAFGANSTVGEWNTSATPAIINITGFKEHVIKFGTDNTSLNGGAYLANIQIDGAAPSEPLALNVNGYLIYESSLSVQDHTAFDFAVYPNPVKDMLHINTQEALQKIEVADLLGRTVFKQNNVPKSVDISSLNKGVYILKLTSEKGISTKKIIKE